MYSEWFPARLNEAREAKGWSLSDLGDRIGKTKQAIAQFERGESNPTPDVYVALICALGVPPTYFDTPPLALDLNPIFFRKLKSARERDVTMAKRRLSWLQHTINCMERYVEFPSVAFPSFELKSDPNDISDDDIEAIAAAARQYWGLSDGAISSVIRLLENQGCIVVRDGLGVPAIDAFSQWQYSKHRPIVALSRDDEGVFFREQASAAHELGHILLHRGIDKRFTAKGSPEHDLLERQANRFASAFLLPASAFRRSVRSATLDGFYLLKMQWLVSIGLMIYRSKDLGMLDNDAESRLWRLRTKRGWNRVEPLDRNTAPEVPQMLSQGVEAIKSGGYLRTWLNEVNLPIADIAQFTALEERALTFESVAPQLRAIPGGGSDL